MATAVRRNPLGLASAGLVLLGIALLQVDQVNLLPRAQANSGDPTCNGVTYDPATQGCCDGAVYDLATQGCCGGTVYDTGYQACCDGAVYDTRTEGCCGGTVYNGYTQACCEECGCVIDIE